ncbi:MAG: peptidoglycan editing factor PgeF [Bacilli bacterium]|nr:peptidoglycan editing factor PgeF [Bacilli bacterium]
MKETDIFIYFNELNDYNVVNLFSKKPLNFNTQKIDKETINNQYKKLQEKLGYKFIKIIKPNQKHTNIVKKVDKTNLNDSFDNVDGLVTDVKGIALATSLADCQGILLYDKKKKVIGNIHSGWKGTLNKIIINAINLMIKEYNSSINDIKVYFSPSILKCCFEVDEDVKNEFLNSFSNIDINKYITKGNLKDNKQKYLIDTIGINVNIIEKMGILPNNITTSNICTKCNNNLYHSHRADKNINGRNICLIAMR